MKDDKGLVKSGRQHGQDFADYILSRAKREGLSANALSFLFAEDITKHTRDMEAEGVEEDVKGGSKPRRQPLSVRGKGGYTRAWLTA